MPIRNVLWLIPFYRRENWGTQRLKRLAQGHTDSKKGTGLLVLSARVSLGHISKGGIVGYTEWHYSALEENAWLFLREPKYTLTSNIRVPIDPWPLQQLVLSTFLTSANLVDMKWFLIVVLISLAPRHFVFFEMFIMSLIYSKLSVVFSSSGDLEVLLRKSFLAPRT